MKSCRSVTVQAPCPATGGHNSYTVPQLPPGPCPAAPYKFPFASWINPLTGKLPPLRSLKAKIVDKVQGPRVAAGGANAYTVPSPPVVIP